MLLCGLSVRLLAGGMRAQCTIRARYVHSQLFPESRGAPGLLGTAHRACVLALNPAHAAGTQPQASNERQLQPSQLVPRRCLTHVHLSFALLHRLRPYVCVTIDSTKITFFARTYDAMRLLKRSPSRGFELVSVNDDIPPPYAILSHTWQEGQEVTYNELVTGTGEDKSGYDKIRFCSSQAEADGLHYFWVDTCCIDKSSSHELSTAINSMFHWYQRASKCYVYLSDVPDPYDRHNAGRSWLEDLQRSRWFTRGWTLQELLAPASVEFFSKKGRWLGTKLSLEQSIHEITRIPINALRGQDLNCFSVEEKFSWTYWRMTTLKEDKVYCLLGIFGVFLSPIYGEGEAHATRRMRYEIQRQTG